MCAIIRDRQFLVVWKTPSSYLKDTELSKRWDKTKFIPKRYREVKEEIKPNLYLKDTEK